MKERLDVLMVRRGLAPSREKAKAMIMAGEVYIGEARADKAGTTYDEETEIDVRSKKERYVSRGGWKLDKAVNIWPIDLDGKLCMDVGASTGGFTDCMLQHGARKVYAVDVGRGQLCWQLRSDPRVVCLEKTNARYLNEEIIPEVIDFATMDVSFISLSLVLPAVCSRLSSDGQLVALIKPQFEAGRAQVGRKGVVRDRKVHCEVIRRITDCLQELPMQVYGLDFSPIRGPEGNIEYLVWAGRGNVQPSIEVDEQLIDEVTMRAHEELKD